MAPSAPQAAGAPPRRPAVVLLVDDQAIIAEAVRRMLADEKEIQFHYCADPTEAIAMAQRVKPTVILQDLVMPEIDGLTLVRFYRACQDTKDIPLVVLSATEEGKTKAEAFALGANDYMVKLPDKHEVIARIRYHSAAYIHLLERNEALSKLEIANRFIRDAFGRYVSDDVVASILESPAGMSLGGAKREVTILMSDLRGFTPVCERLAPEQVVGIINVYLESMTDIILKHQGTILEFIGDAIFVLFGAPIPRPDHAVRAVACAVEMQLAMGTVNRTNREAGLPEVEMGIGINTGDVVVGNIGSKKRTKYGAVGRNVNLASRIESYTLGGQILVSEGTRAACGVILRIDDQMEVMPKGVKEPITIHEVGGIAGPFNLMLPAKAAPEMRTLKNPLPVQYTVVTDKDVGDRAYPGKLVRLAGKAADIEAEVFPKRLSNVKLHPADGRGQPMTDDLYGKVTEQGSTPKAFFRIHFTSVSPEAARILKALECL